MITVRHNDCDLDTFKSRLKRLTDALDDDDFEFYAKEMIEWAIYDNNVKHDKAWTDKLYYVLLESLYILQKD